MLIALMAQEHGVTTSPIRAESARSTFCVFIEREFRMSSQNSAIMR